MLEQVNQVARGHAARLPRYLRALAVACMPTGEYTRLNDADYLDMLAAVLPLHDLGQLVLPTEVKQKPARCRPTSGWWSRPTPPPGAS